MALVLSLPGSSHEILASSEQSHPKNAGWIGHAGAVRRAKGQNPRGESKSQIDGSHCLGQNSSSLGTESLHRGKHAKGGANLSRFVETHDIV